MSDGEVTQELLASPVFWPSLVGLRDPNAPTEATPLRPYPYQVSFWMDRAHRRLILKARQVGLSTAIVVEALHTCCTFPGSLVLVVSREERLAMELVHLAKIFLNSCLYPEYLPALTVDNKQELGWSNGSRMLSLPAAKRAGAGFPTLPTHIYLDEFAWMLWARDIYRAASPAAARGSRMTVLSTPNGRGDMFFALWNGIEGSMDAYSRHRIHWSACPIYNPEGWWIEDEAERVRVGIQSEWYLTTRPSMTARDFASEFDCDFIGSGDPRFDLQAIADMADGWVGLQPPQQGHQYIHCWDTGRRVDAAVGFTLDVTDYFNQGEPVQIVAYERFENQEYPYIQARIADRQRRYGGSTFIEANAQGDPIYENLPLDVRVNTTPVYISQSKKRNHSDALSLLMEQRLLKGNIPQLNTELQLYQDDDKGLVQDCVRALALGAHACVVQPPSGGWLFDTPDKTARESPEQVVAVQGGVPHAVDRGSLRPRFAFPRRTLSTPWGRLGRL